MKGRLGLESSGIPQTDRHGLLWLRRGRLCVEDGNLQFLSQKTKLLPEGKYSIPSQMLNCILLEPGTSVSHEALRLCARYEVGLVAVGEGGVRCYASMPFGPDSSDRARYHAMLWADTESRLMVARRMYAWRLGEILPHAEIEVLRGMEGARMKTDYSRLAEEFGIQWEKRKYNRSDPVDDDLANQAVNHASAAIRGLASVAVAVTGCIPQLGFIHEDSGQSFVLDVADMFRSTATLPIAFAAARKWGPEQSIDRIVRQSAAITIHHDDVMGRMIDRIKEMFDVHDTRRHT